MFLAAFILPNGRCERIRTFDPLHPMQVRYQAAPHTDEAASIALPDCNFACALEARPQQIPELNQLASKQFQSLLRQGPSRQSSADKFALLKIGRVFEVVQN